MNNQSGYTTFEAIFTILFILGIGGWIANIYKLVSSGLALAEWTAMEVFRVIGIFVPPLGSVLGFF